MADNLGPVAKIFLLLWLPLTPTALALTTPKNAKTIKIASPQIKPFIFKNANGKIQGLAVERITKAYAKSNQKVKFFILPWPRAMQMVRTGQMDALAPGYSNPQRRKEFYFSKPLRVSKIVLFHHKSKKPKWDGKLKSLEGLNIGIVRNYTVSEEFDQNKALNKVIVTKFPQLAQMLLRNRIDVMPLDVLSGQALIRSTLTADEAKQISFIDTPPVAEKLSYILCPLKQRLACELFDKNRSK